MASAVIINVTASEPLLSFFSILCTPPTWLAKDRTVIKAVWERDLPCLLRLSCRCPRLAALATHMWKIETLLELAVLLRELLLCSFPNGEKFNYQLICCVVSGDMKFPIVSTPIKCPASTQLFRQLNAKNAGGLNKALVIIVLQTWHHMCQQHNNLMLHSETFQILSTMFSTNLYLC